MNGPGEPTPLEAEVLARLLRGDHPGLRVLRGQLPDLRVASREWTGTGGYAHLAVLPERRPCARAAAHLRDLDGDAPAGAVGFILHVAEGRLSALELHAWGDHAVEAGTSVALRDRPPDPDHARRELGEPGALAREVGALLSRAGASHPGGVRRGASRAGWGCWHLASTVGLAELARALVGRGQPDPVDAVRQAILELALVGGAWFRHSDEPADEGLGGWRSWSGAWAAPAALPAAALESWLRVGGWELASPGAPPLSDDPARWEDEAPELELRVTSHPDDDPWEAWVREGPP